MRRTSGEHTGARIARARKIRRLTQRELADLSNVSYSTVTKVEQGCLAASPSVTGALARAMSIPVTDLTGQPYVDDLQADRLDQLLQPIRTALDVYDLGPDPDVAPRPLSDVHRDAEAHCAKVRQGGLKAVAGSLPTLIHEATAAAHTEQSDRAWAVLASTYRTAYDVTTKLGYTDLCTVALDRMDWAAQRGSDAVVAGIRQYMRALVSLRAGEYAIGRRLVSVGLSQLGQAAPGRERDVATGQLHLGAAVLGARSKDGSAADGHLEEAERIAQRTGEAVNVHWLAFGPTNVGVHRVSTLFERDLYADAVRASKELTIPDDWPQSRTSHHWAEVACAQLWTGDTDGSFRSLQRARKVAPQQTKYHPLVRETYVTLESAHRRLPGSFANYGAWLGM